MNVDWRTAKSNRDAAAAMGDQVEMNEWQDYLDTHFDYTELRADWDDYEDDYDYDYYQASYDAESIYYGEEG